MCKVLIIPAIKKHKMAETLKFVKAMGASMSKGNSDGLGYSAISSTGELFGERWFLNQEAFRPVTISPSRDYTPLKDVADNTVKSWGGALKFHKTDGWKKTEDTPRYNNFGEGDIADMAAITLHTRAATCDRNLTNVHPFVDQDTSVIHNGIINNVTDFKLNLSTCDSETILISYLNNKVNDDITNVQKMVDQLKGYYACGVFSRDAAGERILDVFKMNNNNLSICYIYDLETYVLSSSGYEITEICKMLGYAHDGTQDIQDEYITRINPFTGEIIQQIGFDKPSYQQSSYPAANYHGATDYWNQHNRQQITKFENKNVVTNKIIEAATAKMMELKSDVRELSPREVQEIHYAVGYE